MNKRHTNKPERTRRRMTLHSSFFILRSSLLLLLLAACTNDPTEDIVDVAPGTLPEGTFVIDYTASTGDAFTRATASERIRSLDYLLYESTDNGTTFTLKHRRSIPDINANTVWPLNRETMTWEQRQALKDTLNTACQYKMVFVANADAKLWDSQEVLQNVTEGSSTFDEGRLVLPTHVFTENDMYYMWSNHDAPIMGSEYSKDNPAQMDILLQRMINKVEVKLDDEVVNGINAATGNSYAEKVDAYNIQIISAYYNTYYANTTNQTGKLYDVVANYLKNLNENLDRLGVTNADVKYRDTQKFKNTYLGDTGKNNMVQSINACTETNCTIDNPYCVKQLFIQRTKPLLHNDWSDIKEIHIKYDKDSYPQAIDFNKTTKAESEQGGYIIGQPSTSDNFNSYTFYTFGNSETIEAINDIQSIEFIDNAGNTAFETNVAVKPGNQVTGGNNAFRIIYNPTKDENIQIQTVNTENNSSYFIFTRSNYNLQSLGWTWNDFELDGIIVAWDQDNMINWLNKGLSDTGISGQYDNMTLELTIPMIEIINPWTNSNE